MTDRETARERVLRDCPAMENAREDWKIGIAETYRLGLSLGAVRGRGGSADEPRQALIGATVVCPDLPRIPWRHFFTLRLELPQKR